MAYGRNNMGRNPGAARSKCDNIADPVAKQRCKNMEAANTGTPAAGPTGPAGPTGAARGLGANRGRNPRNTGPSFSGYKRRY